MTIFEQAEQVRVTSTKLPHTMPDTRWWLLNISRQMLATNQTFPQAAQHFTNELPEDLLWH